MVRRCRLCSRRLADLNPGPECWACQVVRSDVDPIGMMAMRGYRDRWATERREVEDNEFAYRESEGEGWGEAAEKLMKERE